MTQVLALPPPNGEGRRAAASACLQLRETVLERKTSLRLDEKESRALVWWLLPSCFRCLFHNKKTNVSHVISNNTNILNMIIMFGLLKGLFEGSLIFGFSLSARLLKHRQTEQNEELRPRGPGGF